MTKQEYEEKYNVRFLSKRNLKLMWLVGWVLGPSFMARFWTAYFIPFKKTIVAYPFEAEVDPMAPRWSAVRDEHEPYHIIQLSTTWGRIKSFFLCFFIPLPVFFSGRWFIEREPYLNDIKKGFITVDKAVDTLHRFYWKPWPRSLMRKWFTK